jgi:UDP-glucose 4-epimerase
MKILVIGGAGYIGSHVVKKLCDDGYQVYVFDDLSSGYRTNIDKRAKFFKGNILNIKDLDKAFRKFNVNCVMHFAAFKAAGESMSNPEKYSENNINGTINILNVMLKHGVKLMVFSSSSSVYGNPAYLPLDEKHPLNPESFYGFTKLEIERILAWYSRLGKLNYAALRYFNAAGYGTIKGKEKNPACLLPIVMEVANGTRDGMTVFGNDYDTRDGTCIRDYIHVLDLADMHEIALRYIAQGKNLVTNVATGKGNTVLEVIKKAEAITGRKINYTIGPRRPGDPPVSIASGKYVAKLLGWKAKHSDIDNIIRTMWDVYKK